jgi:uncharacterized iron-regulated membrane protein
MSPRRLWLVAHRWLALALGVPLAFVALLGAALTVAKPLDRWAHPELFRVMSVASAGGSRLEPVRQALRAEFGRDAAFTFRPPREAHDSLWVIVRGPWNGTVYVDPSSGRELGRRGEHEGVYNLLFELHSSLLLEERGKAALAVLALGYGVLLVSGLVLWWPARWAKAWSVEWRRGGRRTLFDLHRVGGSVLGVFVAVSVASGAYMAWRPLSRAVTAVSGQSAVQPPRASAGAAAERVPLDEAVRRAVSFFPGAMVGYVQVPAREGQPVRVRLKLPDDPHPNGLSSVWLHPSSAQVLAVHRWDRLDPGAQAYTWVYPLHIGELGGAGHTVLNALLGLAIVGFAGSGLWLWRRRRRPPRAASLLLHEVGR